MEVPAARELLKDINKHYGIEPDHASDLDLFISEINDKIAQLDQRIKRVKHEIVNKEFVVFVNTIEDEINMKQTFYTEMDREYFRLLLQEITLNEYSIQRIVALNLIAQLKPKPFSKNHAEELLDDWITLGYFLEEENLLYFGPKTLGEFSDFLAENFEDYVKKCQLCLAAVLMGTKCDKCEKFFHRECLRRALAKALNCPACKQPWDKPV
ncbi:unnamed protein product [Hermetia illucens]|uniref:Non-structural maintenance of chromosomes element 1 homolog n=2 Tax=Hermetia illucens TaxID=343691 RepID=A0A7R8UMS7_HERIL|nr:unnamed protein product [Hermetia illucens]